MDEDTGNLKVSNVTMCPTTQCTTCGCPKEHLSESDLDVVNPLRETADSDIWELESLGSLKSGARSCFRVIGMDGRAIAAERMC